MGGPLALSHPNIVHFISIASLPITPKQNPSINNNNTSKPKWLLPLKALIFAMIARVYEYNAYWHPHFVLVLYCCHLYLGLELVLVLLATPVRTLLGFEIEPQFNEPYLSTSLQDFWGHRWNLTVTRIIFYVLQYTTPYAVTCFFVLHGVCTVVEVSVKKVALRRGWRLHRVVLIPLVVAFMVALRIGYFFLSC
ncbi:hypothetical protein VNO78_27657 [Psophocarpus tetragonolobus]|uniref:Uncharacterized protein n=1 Tax=Psophocarpus tetragonolobus TaxID=3891 RepID=A0AAN9S0S8_PSOTE